MVSQLKKTRIWILVVFSYYLVRASVVIYPKFSTYDDFRKLIVEFQTVLNGIFLIMVLCSFKYGIGIVRWILYIQAVVMSLSNFNIYTQEDTINYQGLNMLSTVFSVLFAVFNVSLAAMVV